MEIWKEIIGFPNYKVSNLGRVKHIEAKIPYMHAVTKEWHYRLKKEKILRNKNVKGYSCVILNSVNKRVCRLVAIAFIPNPENKPEVNHINCNKMDDNVSNLEWVTKSENARHAKANGLLDSAHKAFGERLSIKVKCLRTGIVYNSIKEFSLVRKIHPSNITRALNGTFKNNHDVEYYKEKN
jgi:hypothetical protein